MIRGEALHRTRLNLFTKFARKSSQVLSLHKSNGSLSRRLRIIFFLALSLFFAVSPVLLDSMGPGSCQFIESFINENDNVVAKTGVEIEATRKSNRFQKQGFQNAGNTVAADWERPVPKPALWIRPAYYSFLYRFHLF